MVTATTVICWIFGIGGVFTFAVAMSLPVLFAGQYMILGLAIVAVSMYFNIKYREIRKQELLIREENKLNDISNFKSKLE